MSKSATAEPLLPVELGSGKIKFAQGMKAGRWVFAHRVTALTSARQLGVPGRGFCRRIGAVSVSRPSSCASAVTVRQTP